MSRGSHRGASADADTRADLGAARDPAWRYAPGPQALAGRSILISGATGGLGSALAEACAAAGAAVILLGRDVPALESLYDRIEHGGGTQPALLPVDLAGAAPVDYATVRDAVASTGRPLDGLVHAAAALGQLCPVEHLDPQQWQRTLTINLQAPLLLTQACLPALRQSADASVVFTLDDKTRAYWGGYGVAKAGLAALARILADEWAPPPGESRNVRVNAVDPGPMRTRLRRAAYPAEDAAALVAPQARLAPFLYLLGNDSAGVNARLFRHGERTVAL